MNKNSLVYIISITFLLIISSCNKIDNLTPESRPFYMGFQPWEHDLSKSAKLHAYDNIEKYGDIISTQLDNGVPWEEALIGANYPADVQKELDERKKLTPSNVKVFLTLMPLAEDRNGFGPYWGDVEQSVKEKWTGRNFRDTLVISSYLNHCRNMINFFNPDYFAYALEANAAFSETDVIYQDFLFFCDTVYHTLKIEYPDLPIMLTLVTNFLGGEIVEGTTEQLLEYSDYVAMSSYPFSLPNIKVGDANPSLIPENWFSRFQELAPNKPFCITETAYIAEDLELPAYFMDIKGREEWQAEYVHFLFEEMTLLNAEFVIWFSVRDYNYAGDKLEGIIDPAFYFWIDTGILNEDGKERQSAKFWKAWKSLPVD